LLVFGGRYNQSTRLVLSRNDGNHCTDQSISRNNSILHTVRGGDFLRCREGSHWDGH